MLYKLWSDGIISIGLNAKGIKNGIIGISLNATE